MLKIDRLTEKELAVLIACIKAAGDSSSNKNSYNDFLYLGNNAVRMFQGVKEQLLKS